MYLIFCIRKSLKAANFREVVEDLYCSSKYTFQAIVYLHASHRSSDLSEQVQDLLMLGCCVLNF